MKDYLGLRKPIRKVKHTLKKGKPILKKAGKWRDKTLNNIEYYFEEQERKIKKYKPKGKIKL